MSVDPKTSYRIVKKELEDCKEDSRCYGWKISKIDEINQVFTVRMKSTIDNQEYIVEMKFDNYKEWPLFIEFIDLSTGQRGGRNAYPTGGFFHNYPCVCNPCSRKAYSEFGGPHSNWSPGDWQNNPQTKTLTTIRAILSAIYFNINNPKTYQGRKHG